MVLGIRRRRVARGDILLEVMVALGVFVVGAALLLATATETLAALERAERRERAIDLARSALARLEAGVVNLQDLRAGRSEAEEGGAWGDDRVRLSVRTRRSEWPGLSLIEVQVRDTDATEDEAPLCTIRQLVELRRRAVDGVDQLVDDDPLEEDSP
jgi:type II secretory pathway pseudopilin PulG